MISEEQVSVAIEAAGLKPISPEAADRLAKYANLLLKWNERTNLSGVSTEQGVLDKHIVESVAAAQAIPAEVTSLLDFGTGAGLPGIPIAICRPEIAVTLAESQGKKVAFLREACRMVELGVEIFAQRVAEMPLSRVFDAVTMRAVDRMEAALPEAMARIGEGGWLVLFVTEHTERRFSDEVFGVWQQLRVVKRALLSVGEVLIIQRPTVSRGTL